MIPSRHLSARADGSRQPTQHDARRAAAAQLAAKLARVEEALQRSSHGSTLAERAADHLMSRAGKRLRPTLALIASEIGAAPRPRAAEAVAVTAELIHGASLLHDDVIDVGEERRGVPSARVVFGNAASILAGDFVLIEAMQAVRRAEDEAVLDEMLEAMRAIVIAEAMQLEQRGGPLAKPEVALRIAEGKTAALFRWALRAGARVGGASPQTIDQLGELGVELGVAFQIVDDLLDLTSDPETVGKSTFRDLREGKASYPLALALERQPALSNVLADEALSERARRQRALDALRETGALAVAEQAAIARRDRAVHLVEALPPSPWRELLLDVPDRVTSRVR